MRGKTGREVSLSVILGQSSNGIQDFLYPSYPTLHTQGKEYIVDEVLEYLKEHHAAITSREKELWEYIMVQQPK